MRFLDLFAFAVQPEYAIARGANVPTQDQRRRLGGIRMVDGNDATKAIALIPQAQVPPDAWRAMQAVVASSEGAHGCRPSHGAGLYPWPWVEHRPDGHRSGTGRPSVYDAPSVPRGARSGWCVPSLPRLRLPHGQGTDADTEVRDVLAERAEDLRADFQDFMDAVVKFDTLAGTRLAAKNKMAQALPFLLEVFGNQAFVQQLSQTGWKVNAMELVSMVLEMSEWKNKRDLVVKMTDEEKQTMQQQSDAAQQAQSKSALLNQKQQGDLALEDKKIAGRIAANTVKQTHQAAVESPLDRAASFAERTADEHEMQMAANFCADHQQEVRDDRPPHRAQLRRHRHLEADAADAPVVAHQFRGLSRSA